MMMEGMALVFLVVALVLAGLLAAAIYVGVRGGLGWRRHGDEDARQTLDRRFAAGEIDGDDYHERLAALRSVQSGERRG